MEAGDMVVRPREPDYSSLAASATAASKTAGAASRSSDGSGCEEDGEREADPKVLAPQTQTPDSDSSSSSTSSSDSPDDAAGSKATAAFAKLMAEQLPPLEIFRNQSSSSSSSSEEDDDDDSDAEEDQDMHDTEETNDGSTSRRPNVLSAIPPTPPVSIHHEYGTRRNARRMKASVAEAAALKPRASAFGAAHPKKRLGGAARVDGQKRPPLRDASNRGMSLPV